MAQSNYLVITLCLIFMMTLVVAQSTATEIGEFSRQGASYMDSGVIVNALNYHTVKINTDLLLYMTPYEISGKTLDNESVNCRMGMVSPQGDRLYLLVQENFTVISEDDIWIATVPASFLNETGQYLMNWDCQTGIKGGYFNSELYVTQTGEPLDYATALLYLVYLLGYSALFVLVLYFAIKIPAQNRMNSEGEILGINWLKYLKTFLWIMVYIMLLFYTGTMNSIFESYFLMDNASAFFGYAYAVLLALVYPMLILSGLAIIFTLVDDVKIKKALDRGEDMLSYGI